jgi:hypothetical protein
MGVMLREGKCGAWAMVWAVKPWAGHWS